MRDHNPSHSRNAFPHFTDMAPSVCSLNSAICGLNVSTTSSKAQRIAEQMAKGLNAKLGPLVYASNRAPAVSNFSVNANRPLNGRSLQDHLTPLTSGKVPELELYPQKVKSEAAVYAVFALE